MVECNLAKVEVGGSNPLSRSILPFDEDSLSTIPLLWPFSIASKSLQV